ncbi:hypothetical protein ACIQU4_01175 [Streptomyces sp. NPDC090741]
MSPICGTSVYAAQVASRSLKGQPLLSLQDLLACAERVRAPLVQTVD